MPLENARAKKYNNRRDVRIFLNERAVDDARPTSVRLRRPNSPDVFWLSYSKRRHFAHNIINKLFLIDTTRVNADFAAARPPILGATTR